MGYTGQAVLPHFGALRPDQITDTDCRDYLAKRIASGRKVGAVHTELGHLRSCMNWAVKRRLIDRAPYIERPNKPTPREVFLTRPEMARLISSTTAPHATVALTLLAGTAARVGAILDLTWDRVDFDRSQINLRLDDAMTRKGRAVVPMNGMVRGVLQTAHEAAISEFVVEHGGGPVKSIRTAFNAAKKRADLDHVTIHDVRRSAARFMVEAGVPMDRVAQMLGHSNTAMTEKVYGRFSPDHLQDAAEVLDFTRLRSVK
ncbi:tyrosine-type recombinase/integrase [Tropicimonas aquimaris]|uniref:Tyrosine-type recombinase/integrase n=1 Tax=Tropicimonas aquimaris TaxID=914152 RepID=A0ABW3IMG6_9RHOB